MADYIITHNGHTFSLHCIHVVCIPFQPVVQSQKDLLLPGGSPLSARGYITSSKRTQNVMSGKVANDPVTCLLLCVQLLP